MISPAVFEIEASMHSQSAQIWRNFWHVLLYRPSKTAGDIIFKTAFLHSQSIHLLEFIISSSCSFILLRSSLQWGVIYKPKKKKLRFENIQHLAFELCSLELCRNYMFGNIWCGSGYVRVRILSHPCPSMDFWTFWFWSVLVFGLVLGDFLGNFVVQV